jgi:hypothetical protein
MTLRDLGSQALVSRNICHLQHQFLMRGLGDMSSDGRTDRHNGNSMLPRIFSASIKRRQAEGHNDKQTEMYKMQKFKESAGLYFISSHYHGEKMQPWNGM